MEHWRRLVRRALDGRDPADLGFRVRGDIAVEALYERWPDGARFLGREARPWTVVQIVDDEDPDAANRQALADLNGGATGLSLRFAGAPSAPASGLPPEAAALRIALESVDLAKVHVRLEPHASAVEAASWLESIARETGVAPELASIAFGLDPIAAIARHGNGAGLDASEYGACVRTLSAAGYRGPLAEIDGRIYHEAGATEAQELAAMLAAAAWWLRILDEAGVAPAAALPLIGASLALDHTQFLSIAKQRALRLLWRRLQELCGTSGEPLHVHAETGRRMLNRADPSTNILRTTLAAFAAGAGGAQTITVQPHTAALGRADSGARALARNIQLLLIEEAHLHRVSDPGGGSGAIEALTSALAESAWVEFQRIESEGGIVASLGTGAFQARIAEARAELMEEVAGGKLPLVGATVYLPDGTATSAARDRNGEAVSDFGLASTRLEQLAEAAP